ncbi:hypothetical protein VTJ49DRAFT_310 [Mycothermus thermophilus]|uniref:DUF7582 domain-containing protein n=1 Tax=Humicola insolens TaxID=85995 RepID=A0ABR3VFD1_HUMIN
MGQLLTRFYQRQNARALMELAPARNAGEQPPLPELDRTTLLQALTIVGNYIQQKNRQVTVIAVGGAVNTIFLQSRPSTHDVDFYNNSLSVADLRLVAEGARYAAQRIPQLNEEWFNNHTIFFIPHDLRSTLTQDALTQNAVIFHHGGLKLLAAPWNYAFCTKVHRLSNAGKARPYDLNDAVHYIHRYLQTHRISTVSLATVQEWFTTYRILWNAAVEQIIARVNATYRAQFHVNYNVIA